MSEQNQKKTANSEQVYHIKSSDLPLCCPSKNMTLWNSHPRVYLPIEKNAHNRISCPYCGAVYVLADHDN